LAAALAPLVVVAALLAPADASAVTHLNYYGGPIKPSVTTYLVLWGASTDTTFQSVDEGLLSDLAADSGTTGNVFAMLPEYSTKGLTGLKTGATTNQTLAYDQTYGGKFTITPATCPGTVSCTIENTAIANELAAQVAAGKLPAPTGDGLTSAYIVLFPPLDKITAFGGSSGVNFCSYHFGKLINGGTTNLLYGVIPDNNSLYGSGSGCGENATAVNNETSSLSHQLAELITDPRVYTEAETDIGWYETSNGEIGDICVTSGMEATNTINGHSYIVQKEWSNKQNTCVANSTYQAPSGDFSSTTSANSAGFTASGSSENGDKTIASYSWKFGDGATGSGATPTHAYPAAGEYTVNLTIRDNLGFVKRVTHPVTVSAPPPGTGGGGGTPPSGGGGSSSGPAAPSSPTSTLKCRKGFKKKVVHGKPKCVRIHRHKAKHGH
jgi:hypothetical protein